MLLFPLPTATAALLFLPALASASWGCRAVSDKIRWDFTALGKKHEVVSSERTPMVTNTTWQINPCGPIGKTKEEHPKNQCPAGTQVCGLRYMTTNDGKNLLTGIIPVAGDIHGRRLTEKYERLKTSKDEADQGKEGLRVTLTGGKFSKRDQRAIVEFICDHSLEGDEGNSTNKAEAVEEKEDGDKKPSNQALQFISYDDEDVEGQKVDTLRLKWRTKYACEDMGDGGKSKSGGWGFFTWLVIIVFLVVAAYLIFGSWLNYNRYGARGWDLLPHGDTIRDLPYLMKDFVRRVVTTLQGRGSRGAYSAI